MVRAKIRKLSFFFIQNYHFFKTAFQNRCILQMHFCVMVVFVCFIALRPLQTAEDTAGRSVILTMSLQEAVYQYLAYILWMLVLNQRKRKNGCRNIFITKYSRKNAPNAGINLCTACIPSSIATDRATSYVARTIFRLSTR